ncbi:hypothetical protein SAMN05421504_108306 [Amycolatopsis xylanica]|uniref:Uncharacterized protein n=1 Tax=Amycolatopsis xylanica TaxID=589385 RepID=A0A1H3PPK7_9PSEU|nr:hypothetical protein [Amycolatopsis xylanica]SDZ02369.1 hypothetical protein SAMN05421504_108306 [Amycolatopsis xylanica]
MSEGLRKLIEDRLPGLIEDHTSYRVLQWVFWPVTALLTLAFVATDPVSGSLIMGAPLLLIALTRRQGLGKVPKLILMATAVLSIVPAAFLGRYEASEELSTGLIFFGFVVFLVWVAAFPTMLDKIDDLHHSVRKPGTDEWYRDDRAVHRVLLIRLWMATIIMVIVGGFVAPVLCFAALVFRRRWTAAVAGIACVVDALVSYRYGAFEFTSEPIEIVAGLLAGQQWKQAFSHPLWDPRDQVVYL